MTENKGQPRPGAGNVRITIDGEAMELVPSYAAMAAINGRGGGLRGVLDRITNLDADTIISVILVGLGYGPGGRRPPADMNERIWRTGLLLSTGGLANAAFDYVNILANGGRPFDEESAASKEGAADAAGPPPTAGA